MDSRWVSRLDSLCHESLDSVRGPSIRQPFGPRGAIRLRQSPWHICRIETEEKERSRRCVTAAFFGRFFHQDCLKFGPVSFLKSLSRFRPPQSWNIFHVAWCNFALVYTLGRLLGRSWCFVLFSVRSSGYQLGCTISATGRWNMRKFYTKHHDWGDAPECTYFSELSSSCRNMLPFAVFSW